MKKSLKLRAVVSPTPAIIAVAYDEKGKADACTLAFYTPSDRQSDNEDRRRALRRLSEMESPQNVRRTRDAALDDGQ